MTAAETGSYTRAIPGCVVGRALGPCALLVFGRVFRIKEAAVEWRELMVDGFERLPELTQEAFAGVRARDFDRAPQLGANPLGWTVWHLTRVQDGQVADLMGEPDLWVRDGWHKKFNRPPDHDDSGYGHTPAEVRAFRSPSAKVQLDYLHVTTERTKRYLASLKPADLDRPIEPGPDPSTVAIRLVSILADCHQHAGEAAYINGLLKTQARAGGSVAQKRRSRPPRKAARKRGH